MNSKHSRLRNAAVEQSIDIQCLRRDVAEAMGDLQRSIDRMVFAARRVCGALEGLETEPPNAPARKAA